MAHIQNVLIFGALCALSVTLAQVSQSGPHTNQGGPHENQRRTRRQAEDSSPFDIAEVSNANWTTCDFTVVRKISCHDCNTKMICKQIGGILKTCDNPFKPYCNNGICSAVPSAECA